MVLKARHKETGQIVAIKKIKESDKDEKIRQNTVREVRILKVRCPSAPPCFRHAARRSAALLRAAAVCLPRTCVACAPGEGAWTHPTRPLWGLQAEGPVLAAP